MICFVKKEFLTTCLLLIISNIFAFSQSENDSVRHLRAVIVTQDAKNNQVRSTSPLQIIDKEKLAALNVLQVSDAVKHFSGVTVKDYGGIGGLKTVSVRSLGANHTTVSYDGIALTDVQTGQIDIGRFTLENVDMLSLNSGQSDNIFQPARLFASASVLNVKTLTPTFSEKKKTNGKASVKAGSFGLFNPSFLFNKKINSKLTTSFNAEWLSANGKYPYTLYYTQNKADSSSREIRKNTDVKNLRLEGTLYADFSEQSKGYLKAYFYNSERGLPGATIYYNTQNFSTQRLWDNTFFMQANYLNDISAKWSVQANAKYNRGYLRYLDPATLNSAGKTDNRYVQNELYASFSTLFRAFENISFSTSSDFAINNLDANFPDFAYPTRYSRLSVLAGKYVSNQFLATASLLYTHINENVKNGNVAENQRKLSPYISLSVKPFENTDLRFRVFYKNIFRLPTFNDLYYSRIGNPDLKPENTHQFNIGTTYAANMGNWLPLLSFTCDVYHNEVQNKIVAYPTKNIFEWTMLNYGKVAIDGLDLTMEGAFSLSKNVQLIFGGSHTYQRALNKTNPDERDYDHQIPYTPRVSGSGKTALETPWINIHYSMIWSGYRYTQNQNFKENRVPGFMDHSISASRSLTTKFGTFKALLEVINLTNKNYEIVRSFPMPGRSLRCTFSLKF